MYRSNLVTDQLLCEGSGCMSPRVCYETGHVRDQSHPKMETKRGNSGVSVLQAVDTLESPVPLNLALTSKRRGSLLPPKQDLIRWIDMALSHSLCSWPFLDGPYLFSIIRRLYNTPRFGSTNIDWDGLALLYALIALGQCSDPQYFEVEETLYVPAPKRSTKGYFETSLTFLSFLWLIWPSA